jgi:hypothetical protein
VNVGTDPEGDRSVPPSAVGPTANDACPTCSARMAPDQRYCLGCGHRRGDPRLPFMDAVVFMDAVKQPSKAEAAAATPPPPSSSGGKSGFSPQSTLIAGVATLVLAVGVGVLIGRSGNSEAAPVANNTPQIIKVGGNEGEEETESATGGKEAKGKESKKAKGKGGKKNAAKEKSPELEEGANGGSKASQEVLHTAPGVKEAKPEASVGETCEKGTAGCSEGGEFDGSFFE